MDPKRIIFILSSLLVLVTVAAGIFLYEKKVKKQILKEKITTLEQINDSQTSRINELWQQYLDSFDKLSQAEQQSVELSQQLREEERERKDAEREQEKLVDDLEEVSENLEKIQTIDRELLQKYSKVYFLNENYVPSSLEDIEPEYLRDSKQLQFHGDAIGQLHGLMKRAERDGIDINIASAYRSFEFQQQIKSQFVQQFGAGANTFSADQGFSEHQLGTTIDFSTKSLGGFIGAAFENTPAFAWLQERAHRYGFVLSYPRNNQFYQYEPWHWRFVGEDLARDLHRDNASLYDWEQRRINEYLFEIFE